MHPKTLIVCDVQPEVVKKLPQPRLFCDLVNLAVAAARQHGQTRILYTQLRFDSYDNIPPTHPRLGVLRKLPATVKWFTSSDLCIAGTDKHQEELILPRTTFLPQADTQWTDAFKDVSTKDHQVTAVGYGPTVQTVCHLLGDILALPNVDIIRECVADETPERCQAFLNHGLLFRETVINMTDYLESLDLLHERIETSMDLPPSAPPPNQYVCDVGRGGHLSLFMPYITDKYGYCLWPTQPWYQEGGLSFNKQYYCPLGRWVIPLCDEPQFGSGPRFFLMGRQFLDEKDLLFNLVPELMPPTFHRLEEAKGYLTAQGKESKLLWFLKKVNQNGGRAVDVLKTLPTQPLAEDDQLQAHIPRPLLWEGGLKCHVKTYYYLSACQLPNSNDVEWQLYLHDLFYLAVASKPWSTEDVSDECQITTMRLQRLPADHPWRIQWKLSELCPKHLETIMARAIQQSKLQVPAVNENSVSETNNEAFRTLQFEINSADWMLDEDGRIYLIECNGIPVLYDGGQSQPLCTRGLQLYDSLYKKDPKTAVVNDHDLLKDSVDLAMTGNVPATSLWKLVAAIPAVK